MQPTIESWQTNPLEIGPIYPWVSLEVWMVTVATLFFVYFMAWKLASENRKYNQQVDISPQQSESNRHKEEIHG